MPQLLPDWLANPFVSGSAQLAGVFQSWGWAPWAHNVVTALIATLLVLAVGPSSVLFWIWAERRVVGRIQLRIGPNRVGPYGLLQSVADALKLMTKEDIIPDRVDRPVFLAAPVIVLLPALLTWAIIPWAPGASLVNLEIGVLYLLAIGSLTTLSVIMAGWSSNNKYSLLGGMRAAAQVISYEIPLVLSVVGVVLLSGSLSVNSIVEAQRNIWFVVLQPIGFVVFVIASIAELNRTPFDLVEGESEIIGGYHTEYSGMRFAMFFLAEYLNSFVFGCIAASLFLGGYAGLPYVGGDGIIPPYVWLLLKASLFMFLLFWLRGTLPRLRIDQLLSFAWKVLLPLALVNIFIAGIEAEVLRAFGISLGVRG